MNNKDIKLIDTFINIKQNKELLDSIIKIQNNINIYADSKVIAIATAEDDISLEIVARALSEVYALQEQSTLIIDCNMYNPRLNNLFCKENFEVGLNDIIDESDDYNKLINHITGNLDAVFAKNTNYPTKIFKSKKYFDFICRVKEKYEHIILIMPSIVEHQDILLRKDLITSTLLVARKNRVSKKNLFDSIQILKADNIPYVCTIYLK